MPLESSPDRVEAGVGGREGGWIGLPGPLPGELLPCLELAVPEVSNSQLQ